MAHLDSLKGLALEALKSNDVEGDYQLTIFMWSFLLGVSFSKNYLTYC